MAITKSKTKNAAAQSEEDPATASSEELESGESGPESGEEEDSEEEHTPPPIPTPTPSLITKRGKPNQVQTEVKKPEAVPTHKPQSEEEEESEPDEEESGSNDGEGEEESGSEEEEEEEESEDEVVKAKPIETQTQIQPTKALTIPISSKPMDEVVKITKKDGETNGAVIKPDMAKRALEVEKPEKERKKKKLEKQKGSDDGGMEEYWVAAEKNGANGTDEKKWFARVWSEEDEVVLMKELLGLAKKGLNPHKFNADLVFGEINKDALSFDVSKSQIQSKLARLKQRYQTHAKKEKEPKFSKAHDTKVHKMAKKLWGENGKKDVVRNTNEVSNSNGIILSQYPSLMAVMACSGELANVPTRFELDLKLKALGSSDRAKAEEFERKSKDLREIELKNYIARLQLNMDMLKFISGLKDA